MSFSIIPDYPDFSPISIEMRPSLHPLFRGLRDGVSEFTFANIYLFRDSHRYEISMISDRLIVIRGEDDGKPFFMLPSGLPEKELLERLFTEYKVMKCVTEGQAKALTEMGYEVIEDRDNFDYLYARADLAGLPGAKFHKKRTMLNAFIDNYSYEARPLLMEYKEDALKILDGWLEGRENSGDYEAAREAVERAEELQLCGYLYYVDGSPAAFTMGEETGSGDTFIIHFEKGIGGYRGIYQFVNQAFASLLPEKYLYINREQDLGNEGLRQAKMTYRPSGFVKKYRAHAGRYLRKV